MIRIGHMRLTLPAEFADRAEEIARHVGAALADHPVRLDRHITDAPHLQLTLPAGASSAETGRAIAGAIAARTGPATGGKHG